MQRGWPKPGVENVTCRIIDPPKFNIKPESHHFQCPDVFPWASFLESMFYHSGVKCCLDLVDWRFCLVASNLQIHSWWWGGYGGGRPPAVQPGAMNNKASEKLAYEKIRFGVSKRNKKLTTDHGSKVRVLRHTQQGNSWSGCCFSVGHTTDQVFLGGWTMPLETSRSLSFETCQHAWIILDLGGQKITPKMDMSNCDIWPNHDVRSRHREGGDRVGSSQKFSLISRFPTLWNILFLFDTDNEPEYINFVEICVFLRCHL